MGHFTFHIFVEDFLWVGLAICVFGKGFLCFKFFKFFLLLMTLFLLSSKFLLVIFINEVVQPIFNIGVGSIVFFKWNYFIALWSRTEIEEWWKSLYFILVAQTSWLWPIHEEKCNMAFVVFIMCAVVKVIPVFLEVYAVWASLHKELDKNMRIVISRILVSN